MFKYPADIARDSSGYMVSFPDVPEAITSGGTKEEAVAMGRDALTTALEFYFEDRRRVPLPSSLKPGQTEIELPTSVAVKVLLLNEMVLQNIRPAELARKMNVRPQEVTRILDLHHATKIDTVATALAAMGQMLELRLEPI
ncbi:antitoxin HicB [Acidovorax sp. 62]|uniref:type II toxin-antitoxin system HicB family antitoxin n=1 Tax=Acidovorax sp. 62 TaxID=2035203 RepID=UPI000C198633|nr:type II toxin-antitoxin system HicB family antitoxin [Acidovorax sp. 62]PIF89754.1 antitoxin HicB [Acidovorax sp. 62]